MALRRDLSQTYVRMRDEKKQAVITSGNANTQYGSLQALNSSLKELLKYRNGANSAPASGQDGKDDTNGIVQNICNAHFYTSFAAYLTEIGQPTSTMSLGNMNDMLDALTNCTCNGRQIRNCSCVSRELGNSCACNTRTAPQCTCEARNGSKYGSACDCLSRLVMCQCVSRSSESVSCSCDGRCSCNVVNEFSMDPAKPIGYCQCVSRDSAGAPDTCQCHTRTVPTYQIGPNSKMQGTYTCDCQTRGSFHSAPVCACNLDQGDRTYQITIDSDCSCNARDNGSNAGWTFNDVIKMPDGTTRTVTSQMFCACENRVASQGYTNCACNARATGSGNYCDCQNRYASGSQPACNCNLRARADVDTDYCQCVNRTSSVHTCAYHVIGPNTPMT